ncbi:hypothetical protein MY9_1134 [Bacillus sp. JS]|nr:hypothetical protein MY9_1134 [Bacillus sp. JS]
MYVSASFFVNRVLSCASKQSSVSCLRYVKETRLTWKAELSFLI